MHSVFSAAAIYVFLVIIFRVSGRRTMAETTTFDLVLLLIISEAIQQALVSSDQSITGAIVVVCTLVGLDIGLSFVKQRFSNVGKVLDGLPVVILRDGKLLEDRARNERVDIEDILAEARRLHGLESLSQIKYAVVEENGEISIIPRIN